MKVLDPQAPAVAGDADIDGQRDLGRSPMVATSFACHSPFASCFTSQILEVSAVAATAQLSPGLQGPADFERRAQAR